MKASTHRASHRYLIPFSPCSELGRELFLRPQFSKRPGEQNIRATLASRKIHLCARWEFYLQNRLFAHCAGFSVKICAPELYSSIAVARITRRYIKILFPVLRHLLIASRIISHCLQVNSHGQVSLQLTTGSLSHLATGLMVFLCHQPGLHQEEFSRHLFRFAILLGTTR